MKNLLVLILFSGLAHAQTYSVGGVAAQYTLVQWGIPVVLPGGGAFSTTPSAASGLTLTVALPNTAACTATIGCYMYFPVNVISGANAAGTYFTQCSDTTHCSVFNNLLSTGPPVTVSSPTSFGTVAGGAYTQTVGSFVTLVTINIPANTMGANGSFTVEQRASRVSNAGSIAQQFKFAGNIIGLNGAATVQAIGLRRTVQNIGYTGKQISDPAVTPFDISQINTAMAFTTVDTTAVQALALQGELITSATDWLVTLGGSVWVNYAP